MQVRIAGTLALEVEGTLIEMSPEPRKGMVELVEDDKQNKWRLQRLKKFLKSCGGHIYYQMHPQALDFLKCFCFTRTYANNEKYVCVCNWMNSYSTPVDRILERECTVRDRDRIDITNYFNDSGGWAMLGSADPASSLMPVVLSRHFTKFETNVMGLPKRKIRDITQAMLTDHYIQFTMRDGKGGFNSLMALVPLIVEAIKKPRFPTPEIQELCETGN